MPGENKGTERETQGVGRYMSCPRELFLDERKVPFVDMTYPKGWTGSLPLCTPHFLLAMHTYARADLPRRAYRMSYR